MQEDSRLFVDVVIPEGNEAAFLQMAECLGYGSLCFLYPYGKGAAAAAEKKIQQLQQHTEVKLRCGFLCSEKNIQSAAAAGHLTFLPTLQARDAAQKQPSVMYGMETAAKGDFVFSRRSGLDQVSCKLAKENNVIIGFSAALVIAATHQAVLMGRISQNIRFCRKYRNETAIFSLATAPYLMRAPHDMLSLFEVMGMMPGEARAALSRFSQAK